MSLALPFLPRWIILALFLVFQGWAVSSPPIAARRLCTELWGRLMWQQNKAPVTGFKKWLQGSVGQFLCLPALITSETEHSEGSSLRGCVSLDTAKGPRVTYMCTAVILTHYWITWVCTRISNTKESRSSQKLLIHSGQHSEKQMLENKCEQTQGSISCFSSIRWILIYFFPPREFNDFWWNNTANKDFTGLCTDLNYSFGVRKWFILQSQHFI